MTTLKLLRSYDEISNIRTFVFETGGVSWIPGQYQTYELPQIDSDDRDDKKRFFTIASAPNENEIHISTRVSDSLFKQALNSLQPGETIEAHDIEGDFTWDGDDAVVLVAGGIGVTPFRSMLVARAADGRPLNAHLLYYGRDENFAFRAEFDAFVSEHPELKIDYIVGEPVSAETITGHAPEVSQNTTYLSGPEAMVDTVGDELTARGVELKQDWFPGYDDQSY